jgi:integrase
MTGLNHVIRRGAIYVWRRRISVKVTDKAHAYLQVSLRTSRFSTAKTLANVANFAFATSMIEMEHGRITRAEAQRFLAKLVIDELTRIEENRYFEPQAKSPIEWRTRYLMERNRAIAARLVAARGTGAAIFRDDRAELADGLTETDMAQIEREIVSIQQRVADKAFIEETCDLAAGELGRNPSSEADLRALVSVRLAAEAEALNRSDRRKTIVPFMGCQMPPFAVASPDSSDADTATPLAMLQKNPHAQADRARERRYSTNMQALLSDYAAERARLTADKDGKTTQKDLRQRRSILGQFIEAVEVSDLTALRQDDINHYFEILAVLPKNHGKSPADRSRSLDEILERAEALASDQIGLSANTVNRNITVLTDFLKFCRKRGIYPGEPFELADYRMQTEGDARSVRLAFSEHDLELIAAHPIWQGCDGETRRHLKGNQVIRDGLFWVPIIGSLSGMRREEICGLAQEDIDLEGHVPHFILRRNHNRGLKNVTSERLVPIHSAILKAGFATYVESIRTKGHVDLFPDLRPNSSNETFGNVFYKKWQSVPIAQLGDGASRKTFHSLRHRVITVLRHDTSVPKEVVKDLVGHKHTGETDGRYRGATPLHMLQEAVERIPAEAWVRLFKQW